MVRKVKRVSRLELFEEIEYELDKKRMHTDNDITINSGAEIEHYNQQPNLQSPLKSKLINQYSDRKLLNQ